MSEIEELKKERMRLFDEAVVFNEKAEKWVWRGVIITIASLLFLEIPGCFLHNPFLFTIGIGMFTTATFCWVIILFFAMNKNDRAIKKLTVAIMGEENKGG